jgi:hypothetical protein
VVCLTVIVISVACGKKGPPLPPLARMPAPVPKLEVGRVGDAVYLWFTVPAANTSGKSPADLSAIELYAVTASRPPVSTRLTDAAVRVGTYPVRPVLPVPPPAEAGSPTPPLPARPPGFDQGAAAVLRETLTGDLKRPTVLPNVPRRPAEAPTHDVEAETESIGPLVAPTTFNPLRRYYFVVPISSRGRPGSPSPLASVPLDEGSSAPSAPEVTYTEAGYMVKWTAPPDARTAVVEAGDPGALPAKPIVPGPVATGYLVFDVPGSARPEDPFAIELPKALNSAQAATEYSVAGPVRYGTERCFVVRSSDTIDGTVVAGAASPPGCVTPVDTFPPAAPKNLAAIAAASSINLIWDANTESDLAGYIVLRGDAPGDTLQALTPTPIRETTFADRTVTPGRRYVYAVVAVDAATPQNVSGRSNRVEETARQ